MNAVWSAAREVIDWLDERGTPSCLICGLAVLRWGEPRFTRDVDLTVLAPFGEETAVIDSCLAKFAARIPDAREFASTRRILLLKASKEDPDIGRPFEDFLRGAQADTRRL